MRAAEQPVATRYLNAGRADKRHTGRREPQPARPRPVYAVFKYATSRPHSAFPPNTVGASAPHTLPTRVSQSGADIRPNERKFVAEVWEMVPDVDSQLLTDLLNDDRQSNDVPDVPVSGLPWRRPAFAIRSDVRASQMRRPPIDEFHCQTCRLGSFTGSVTPDGVAPRAAELFYL